MRLQFNYATVMNVFAIYFIFMLSVLTAQDTKSVLFLGNSYTAYNNLPEMVSSMATNTGAVLNYDTNTPGGYRFMQHASNATSIAKIQSQDWNYVVLQGQSQETSLSPSQMETEVYPFVTSLVNEIQNNACSKALLYQTWGRENGDTPNCAIRPWVCTYESMDDTISATYQFLAEDNSSYLSPVGVVWRYLRENHPSIDLYTGDGSHPSIQGSYVAACVFYTMIFQKDPSLITWNATLSEADASAIRIACKNIVFNEVHNYNFSDNVASFTEVIQDNVIQPTLSFGESNTMEILWDFGDGATSDEIQPIHAYAENGTYTIYCTLIYCGRTYVFSKEITIATSLSLDEAQKEKYKIYPNPTTDIIMLDLNSSANYQVQVYSHKGTLIMEQNIKGVMNTISLKKFPSGIYYIKLIHKERAQYLRVLKE